MAHDESDTFESPHRIKTEDWSALVTELGADKGAKTTRSRARNKATAPTPTPSIYAQQGQRSAWEIALQLAGRLGRDLGEGKRAVLCINDAQHSHPDGAADQANGGCVLLPPEQGSMFGLPKCSHSHCGSLTLRRWIAAVGYTTWEEAVLQARGWKRAREFLLHDKGISGWKRIPFELRDGEDTVAGGPTQIVPDEAQEYCDFPVRIVAHVEEHDASTSRGFYEIEATVSGRTRRFRVVAHEFNSLAWVSQLGPEAVIMPGQNIAQKLRAAVQFLSKPVVTRDVYTTTGWRQIGGKPVYLHAAGGIGADGPVEGVSVSLAGDVLPNFTLPPIPEGKALKAAVRACAQLFKIAVPEVAIPLFGTVWRAPLGPSPLSIYLNAPPTSGKSMLAALAQQHFGAAMNEGALPASVKNATAASVNLLRSLVGDAVFVFDDFMVSGNTAEDLKLSEKIDVVVRAQYGGTGAQRLARDGTLATAGTPPRSTLILTGETLPRSSSLRSRLLVLDLPGPIVENLNACKSAGNAGVYASAMAAYLRWLAPRLETMRNDLRGRVQEIALELRKGCDVSDRDHRTSLLLAEVCAGMQSFLAFALDVGALSDTEAEDLRQIAWNTLLSVTHAQLTHRAAQDPVLRFFDLISAALGAGRCHVALDDGTAPEDATAWGWRVASSSTTFDNDHEDEPSEQNLPVDHIDTPHPTEDKRTKRLVYRGMGDCLGVVRTAEGLVWLKAEIALRVARSLAAEIGDPLPITHEDLGRRLYERGLLAKSDKGTNRSYLVRGPKEAEFGRGYLCITTRTLATGNAPAVSG